MNLVIRSDRDGVAVLSLNDPGRRNVLSSALIAELTAEIDRCERDEAVSAVVLTGEGSAFCAGAERDNLLAAAAGEPHRLREVYHGFLRVARCALPTVAAVNGPAVGAGFNLALVCDVRIAAPEARFDCRFGSLGLHPGGGHTWLLDRAVGRQVAAALLLFGETLDGEAAVTAGLALRCVPHADLAEAAADLARGATRTPRRLLPALAASLRQAATVHDLDTAVELEFDRQVSSMADPEFAARIGG